MTWESGVLIKEDITAWYQVITIKQIYDITSDMTWFVKCQKALHVLHRFDLNHLKDTKTTPDTSSASEVATNHYQAQHATSGSSCYASWVPWEVICACIAVWLAPSEGMVSYHPKNVACLKLTTKTFLETEC